MGRTSLSISNGRVLRLAPECRIDFYCVQQIMNFCAKNNTRVHVCLPYLSQLYTVLPWSYFQLKWSNVMQFQGSGYIAIAKNNKNTCNFIITTPESWHFLAIVDLHPFARTRDTVKLAHSRCNWHFYGFFVVVFT